jgi:hypothetical protein
VGLARRRGSDVRDRCGGVRPSGHAEVVVDDAEARKPADRESLGGSPTLGSGHVSVERVCGWSMSSTSAGMRRTQKAKAMCRTAWFCQRQGRRRCGFRLPFGPAVPVVGGIIGASSSAIVSRMFVTALCASTCHDAIVVAGLS